MHIDQKFISFLQQHDERGISEIYKLFGDKVKRMIIANSGTEEEAADIFQESLIDIYKLSMNKDFVLTCSFEAFIIIVSKRKWLSTLKSGYKSKVTNLEDNVSTYDHQDENAEALALKIEKENTVMLLLEKMGEKCKEIIKACLKEKRQEVVAATLGLTYAYLRKKKSMCMGELSEMVKQHQLFKN